MEFDVTNIVGIHLVASAAIIAAVVVGFFAVRRYIQ